MIALPDNVLPIVEQYKDQTDAPKAVRPVAAWFVEAVLSTHDRGGCAAVEFGVLNGGMSSLLMAAWEVTLPHEGRLFLSVDPYGNLAYYGPGPDRRTYGEDSYNAARENLRRFQRSAFFRMAADDFIAHVLPTYRWWFGGRAYPPARRFLAFAYLDGQHEASNVVHEVAGVYEYMAPGGIIAVDNTELVPDAIALLDRSQRLRFARHDHWEIPSDSQIERHHRDAFVVP